MSNLIKSYQIALYLDETPSQTSRSWKRVCKTTELTLSMNPETEDLQFICDENATTELNAYKPTINQPLRMYKGDAIFEYLWDKVYNMEVGDAAKTNVLVVFIFDADSQGAFKAWQVKDSTLVVSDINAVDSELTFDINFGGTVEKGTATITSGTPTFTAAQ